MTDIYYKAVKKFGVPSQVTKALEELSELSVALLHYYSGKMTIDAVADEIADVEIMCSQLRHIIGDEIITARKNEKLARLSRMINE